MGYNWKKGRGTLLLLASIALAYIIELAWGAPGNDSVLLKLGAMPDTGGLHGEYWRLITAGFLHSNNMHILLNATCLFLGGSIVEHRVGSAATILLFTVSSVLGSEADMLQHLFLPTAGVSVGASAGVFGTFGAAVVLLQRVPAAHPAVRRLLWFVLAVGFVYSFFPNVSMVSHATGFAVGIAIGCAVRIEGSNLHRASVA